LALRVATCKEGIQRLTGQLLLLQKKLASLKDTLSGLHVRIPQLESDKTLAVSGMY